MHRITTIFPDLDPVYISIIKNRLETFFEQLDRQGVELDIDPGLETDLIKAVFFSEYIASGICNDSLLFKELVESNDLNTPYSSTTYAEKIKAALEGITDPAEIKQNLFRLKVYESVRVAWRDLTGKAGLEETMEDLSWMAGAIVDTVMAHTCEEAGRVHGIPRNAQGVPQQMIVLGMGKLGAEELNFSSDIDLIFVFPEEGETDGNRVVSNGEFFTRVCRNFQKFFAAGSHSVNFYRIDTRLRPFGNGGPIVMGAQAFESYYQAQGREWERYAMIKARPVAGDIAAGRRLLKGLNAFIYRRYFDYGSFDSFREMKQRISLQVKNKRLKNNIKLGAGGIREIEFFGQLFQLIRGGVEPRLQERKILKVLDLLQRHRCISGSVKEELKEAYVFLRRVENRLQAYADLQTHDLPEKKEQRVILARSMGYDSWELFIPDLQGHMERVHFHFNQLLVTDEDTRSDPVKEKLKEMWVNITDPQFTADAVKIGNFKEPEKVLTLLRALESHPNTRKLTPSGRKKLARLVPHLIRKISEQERPDDILVKLIDLIITIERRTCYLSLLVENKRALDTLVTLAQKSPWIITFLSGHPALLDELMQPDTLYSPPDRDALEREMADRMSGIPMADFEYILEELCVFRQINMLRVAAADVSGSYPLMKVSDHLTYIAETVLSQVLQICWHLVCEKYGTPEGIPADKIEDCGFAVVAYGKVGGFEMGYKSDIDIVFLYRGEPGRTQGKEKHADITTFYSNLGQRIIHALTMHTPAGTLYGADMRLRPGGDSGMIVSHIESYEDYMEKNAWTWEHQALIRARPVTGDRQLCSEFNRIRRTVLTRQRDELQLKRDVSEMREKVRNQRLKVTAGEVDLSQSRGGIVDIEFLVQYLILKHAHAYPDITVWTDNIRLLESLDAEGLISSQQSEQLQSAYVAMRRMIHRRNLQENESGIPEDQVKTVLKIVRASYDAFLT